MADGRNCQGRYDMRHYRRMEDGGYSFNDGDQVLWRTDDIAIGYVWDGIRATFVKHGPTGVVKSWQHSFPSSLAGMPPGMRETMGKAKVLSSDDWDLSLLNAIVDDGSKLHGFLQEEGFLQKEGLG